MHILQKYSQDITKVRLEGVCVREDLKADFTLFLKTRGLRLYATVRGRGGGAFETHIPFKEAIPWDVVNRTCKNVLVDGDIVLAQRFCGDVLLSIMVAPFVVLYLKGRGSKIRFLLRIGTCVRCAEMKTEKFAALLSSLPE